jgi:hypothetical protein
MKRIRKAILITVALLLLVRYFPVVYHAIEFNNFVKLEAQRNRIGPQLQRALLAQAAIDFLPVKSDDIRIKEGDGLIRVSVDYKVPVNLLVFTHELGFHASGAGLGAN